MRYKEVLFFLAVCFLLTACGATSSPSPTPGSSNAHTLPTPASALGGSFVWQTDGLYDYRMLRPEHWEASASECRFYFPPGSQDQADRLALAACNYQIAAQQLPGGMIAQFELFKLASSLAGWTQGVEQMWQSNGIASTLLSTLPQAKIYSIQSPGSPDLQIIAFVIDHDQPLALSLYAYGAYADPDRLRSEHVWDDFVTMVTGMSAIDYDPSKVTPALTEK